MDEDEKKKFEKTNNVTMRTIESEFKRRKMLHNNKSILNLKKVN